MGLVNGGRNRQNGGGGLHRLIVGRLNVGLVIHRLIVGLVDVGSDEHPSSNSFGWWWGFNDRSRRQRLRVDRFALWHQILWRDDRAEFISLNSWTHWLLQALPLRWWWQPARGWMGWALGLELGLRLRLARRCHIKPSAAVSSTAVNAVSILRRCMLFRAPLATPTASPSAVTAATPSPSPYVHIRRLRQRLGFVGRKRLRWLRRGWLRRRRQLRWRRWLRRWLRWLRRWWRRLLDPQLAHWVSYEGEVIA